MSMRVPILGSLFYFIIGKYLNSCLHTILFAIVGQCLLVTLIITVCSFFPISKLTTYEVERKKYIMTYFQCRLHSSLLHATFARQIE